MALAGLSVTTLLGGGMALAGALVALLGLRHGWRAAAVLRAPPAGEDGAANAALVRLAGSVDAADEAPIEAPFSGVPSVVVRHVVEERQLSPNLPLVPWNVTIREGTASAPFEVRTPATTARVDGNVKTAVLATETVAAVGPGESTPDRIASFDAEDGLDDRRSALAGLPGPLAGIGRAIGLGRRTYGEQRLEPGDEATVVGHPVGDGRVDPVVVSDRSPRRTFLAMARTGLVATVVGLAVLAFGAVLLLA